jgi:hypothetical protein
LEDGSVDLALEHYRRGDDDNNGRAVSTSGAAALCAHMWCVKLRGYVACLVDEGDEGDA